MIVISIGVIKVRSAAWIGKVRETPLTKSNWFNKIAVTAHNINAKKSFFSILFSGFLIKNNIQNKTALMESRVILIPKGPAI